MYWCKKCYLLSLFQKVSAKIYFEKRFNETCSEHKPAATFQINRWHAISNEAMYIHKKKK